MITYNQVKDLPKNHPLMISFMKELEQDNLINEELVKNGMAVIYNFTESDKKMDELEVAAKKQKIGIWQGAFQLPKEYRKAHPRH